MGFVGEREINFLALEQRAEDMNIFFESDTVAGGCLSIRMAVLPVPRPMKQRLGASRLMVAIPFAATGAERSPGTATPVPRRNRCVCCATSAMTAQTLGRIIGLSVIQQKSYPRFSA